MDIHLLESQSRSIDDFNDLRVYYLRRYDQFENKNNTAKYIANIDNTSDE